ncbi:MAG: MATE family efflux transporter [Clostridia bacterium]|nr:MATE family efflux transporter [Clostridia bacterium]
MLKKKDVNMLSGSIVKGLLTIAIPVMVMNILQSIYNIVDMTVLKMYDTGNSVGAVGVSGYLISLVTGLLVGISSGTNVVVARHIGKGDTESAQKAVGTAILFSLFGGLTLTVIGVSGARLFITWMNCDVELLPQAVLYFRLYFIGVPILMVYNFCASILRSTGDSKRPMIYLSIAGAIKVGATLLFVGVFNLKVTGVALATILSWSLSAVLGLQALIRNEGAVKLRKKYLRIYKEELKEMLFLGIPAGLQSALYSIANVIISSQVNLFGKQATTGISIANQFDGIMYQISVAPSLAVMAYVSQNIGAGNIKRAQEATIKGMMITVALGASFGALSAIFSGQLSSIMSDDPVAIAYSQQKMVIISATYFLSGVNEVLGASMRGMRRPMVAMISTMIFMCGIRFIWVYGIYIPFLKGTSSALTFLYLIWPIGWVLSIITLLCFFFPTVRKHKRLAQINQAVNQENQ